MHGCVLPRTPGGLTTQSAQLETLSCSNRQSSTARQPLHLQLVLCHSHNCIALFLVHRTGLVPHATAVLRTVTMHNSYSRQLILTADGATLGLDWFEGCDAPGRHTGRGWWGNGRGGAGRGSGGGRRDERGRHGIRRCTMATWLSVV